MTDQKQKPRVRVYYSALNYIFEDRKNDLFSRYSPLEFIRKSDYDQLAAELVECKEKLLTFEGMTFSENTELQSLREKLKVAVEALRKYKDIAWATGNKITREESMAASTALKHLDQTIEVDKKVSEEK